MNYQPNWVCSPCGRKYSNGRLFPISTYHTGICDVCKKETAVTEPRDFGYLKPEWKRHLK